MRARQSRNFHVNSGIVARTRLLRKLELFGENGVNMDHVLSNVVLHVLSRHTEISFHAEGVPDPLYGPWYAGTLQADDEAGAAVAALRDSAVVHQELFREVDAFLDFRFNTVSARPNFVTYWCNHRLIAVSTTIHLGSVVNVAAVSRSWMRAVSQAVSNQETVVLRHLINASNARRFRHRILQDDWDMCEGHCHARIYSAVHRGRVISPNW